MVREDIPLSPQLDPPSPIKEERETIKNGWTLSDILARYNLQPAEIHKLREDVKSVYDLAKIKAGQQIRIYTDSSREIDSIQYYIDNENYLHIRKKEETYLAEIKSIPYEVKTKMTWGIIEDNLVSALTQKNEKVQLAISLEDLFAWDIDFYADLRRGDMFKVIFEVKYFEGEFVGYQKILAAEFINQGKRFQAFRYTYPDTAESDYFDFQGKSLRKEFLKSPIGSARITSRFSFSRLHPIRKVYRPHYGVDYAARVGTPVQATAAGKVTFVGWNGASGRMIRISHKNAYETIYLHLRGFAKGIKRGANVEGGKVIGFVGSSGESTGPHLDYRIKQRGKYINPLSARFKPLKPLRTEYFEDFKTTASQFLIFLEAPLLLHAFLPHPVMP